MGILTNAWRSTACCTAIFILYTGGLHAQGTTAFDSAFQRAQAAESNTQRLIKLEQIEDGFPDMSATQGVKLGEAMVAAALPIKADTGLMRGYALIGDFNLPLNNFPAALNGYFKQLEIAERINDFNKQVGSYEGISWVYRATGESSKNAADLDKAMEYIKKSLEISRKHNLPTRERQLLNDLAILYDIKKMHAKAMETFKQGIVLAVSAGDTGEQMRLLINMGISLKNNREFSSSLAAYQAAARIADSLPGGNKLYLFGNMAILYDSLHLLDASEKNALLVINNPLKITDDRLKMDMYRLLTDIYEKQGKYQDAFTYLEKLSAIKDSIFDQDKSLQVKDMQEKYDTNNKNKQIALQQAQIKYDKTLNIVLAAGGLFVLLVAGFIYYNLRKTAALNRTVMQQRDELGKQSTSLSVMMKELHHRVKNNLQIVSSLLNLQSMRLTDEGAIGAVQESKQRVQAMALIHQRLYKTEDITSINMKEYIKELADFLATSYGYGPDNFNLELDIEEERVDIDKALPLGLILNELLTNAFKYAFSGIERPALHIAFKHAEGNFTLVVKDNGKGIQPGVWDADSDTSFGRQLVKALCMQLHAEEQLEVDNGTNFMFIIPEAA